MPAIPPKPPVHHPRRESDVKSEVLLALAKYPQIRVWPSPSGLFFAANGAPVRVGVEGVSDFTGIAGPRGTIIALEFKSPRGRQREAQRRFQAMIEERGGVYLLARSADEVIGELQLRGLV